MLVHCLSSCLSTCLAEETCGVCGEKLWRRNFGRDARSFGSFTTNSFSIWALFELKLWAPINGTGTAHLADGQTAFTKRCKRCKVFSENSLCQRAFIKESSLNIPRQRMSAEPRSEYHVNTMWIQCTARLIRIEQSQTNDEWIPQRRSKKRVNNVDRLSSSEPGWL